MPGASVPLPFLEPPPTQTPLVDPSTGMLTANWTPWFLKLYAYVFGVWRPIPFDATNFQTEAPGVSWVVQAADVIELKYFQMGNYAVVQFMILTTAIVGGDVSIIGFKVPQLKMLSDDASAHGLTVCAAAAGAASHLAFSYAVNNSFLGTHEVGILFERTDGTDFLAADPIDVINGTVIFQCQSVTTP